MERILNGEPSTEKTYVFNGNKPEELSYSGTSPKGGSLVVRADGTILLALHNGTWCASKGMGDKKIMLTRYESETCVIPEGAKDPIITLKGEATITLKVGETYTEPGVEAKTVDGSELNYTIEIKKDEEVVTGIDTNKAGRYMITYRAESNGKTSTVTRVVVIKIGEISGSKLAIQDNLENLADLKRYRGSNPNNWVCFGDSSVTKPSDCDENHKWRIIGIDNNGQMKIMTNYYYSTRKTWDTTGGVNGSNNWARPADLKMGLEGSAFYSNNAYIDTTSREYITNGTWKLGGNKTSNYQFQDFVNGEKEGKSTTGYVGLISVTDVGYASSSCTLAVTMTTTNNECMGNNWIFDSQYDQWTITPLDNDRSVWYVHIVGSVSYTGVFNIKGVHPVVYLDSSVKITDGNGTKAEPYILKK